MDINSVQGPAAYANTLNTTPPVENTQTRDQNVEASGATLDSQTRQAAQQAFEVNITPEARDRLAQETQAREPAEQIEPLETAETAPQEPPQPVENRPVEDQARENPAPAQGPDTLVNIVA